MSDAQEVQNTVFQGRAAPPEDPATLAWIKEQEIKSIDNLEAAARQIITLTTAMLGLSFALLALDSDPLPLYMRYPLIRTLAGLSIAPYIAALVFALRTVWPFPTRVNLAEPGAAKRGFESIRDRKQHALRWAARGFGTGLVFQALVVAFALIFLI